MRAVIWSVTALEQYDKAIDYLAARSPEAAERLGDRIGSALDILTRRPIGRPGQRDGTFEKVVVGTPYLLVFALSGGPDGELRVVRLFHMSQDWQNESSDLDQT